LTKEEEEWFVFILNIYYLFTYSYSINTTKMF
jgi:hypothetical protein